VSAGGALGAPARYGMTLWLASRAGGFPRATLWTNITGSFLLGVMLIFVLERFGPSRYLRAFLGTGFCGAYTTMSSFAVEVDLLVRDGHTTTAGAYVGPHCGGAARGVGWYAPARLTEEAQRRTAVFNVAVTLLAATTAAAAGLAAAV
jgi:CrcB protein